MSRCWLLAVMLATGLAAASPAWSADVVGLIETLREGDENARIAAKRELVEVGPDAVQPLLALVSEKDAKLSQAARDTLRWLALGWANTESRRERLREPLVEAATAKGDLTVRESALELLGIAGDARAVPEIAHLLHDPDIAPAACRALQTIPGTDALAALVVALDWAPPGLQVQLLRCIGSRPDQRTMPDVLKLVRSPEAPVRAAAVDALGRIGDGRALPELQKALGDPDASVRAAAADACLRLGRALLAAGSKQGAGETFAAVLANGKTEPAWTGALTGLGEIGDAKALAAIRPFLKHDNRRVRVAAIAAAAKLPGTEATQALAASLAGAPSMVAVTVLRALGERADATALGAIRPLAASDDAEVRAQALWALGQLRSPDAAPDLKAALEADDATVAGAARDAYLSLAGALLADGAGERARTMYEDLAALADRDERWTAALDGLGNIGSEKSLPVLAGLLDGASGEERDKAFSAYLAICRAMVGRKDMAAATEAYAAALKWVPELSAVQGPDFDRAHQSRMAIADGLAAAGAADGAKALYRAALAALPADVRLGEVAGKLRALGEPIDMAAVQGFVREWWLIGPFPNRNSSAWGQRFFPEDEVKLDQEYDLQGTRMKWQRVTGEGVIDLMTPFGGIPQTDYKAAYAYAEVFVDQAQPVIVKMGSDDTIACWLNGKQIHANLVDRGTTVDQDVVRAEVQAGRNTILVKVLNNGGGWNFVVRLCDAQGHALRFTQGTDQAQGGGAVAPPPANEVKVRFDKVRIADGSSLVETCAVCDVNKDGKLDIISGGNWYEAPDWKPHLIREMMNDGHYANDWADMALDVNGDGWVDLVSGGFHTDDISWYENPQGKEGPWPKHLILKRKDFFETMVMVDLDGDGEGELLPNDAAPIRWYDLVRAPGKEPEWVEHVVGQDGAAHGVGYGDVDLDGHIDIICPTGWYEAPDDLRQGAWTWHPEFNLGSTSVPILSIDVNGDGLGDLIWGEGHSYGLFWLEQKPGVEGKRLWERHTIDASWSQAHAPELADIDGDGGLDLVAGKRHKAHDTDPGVDEPLCVYWYEYDRAAGQWQRWVVSYSDGAGIGLQQVDVDMNGDGKIDIVSACKTGLHLFLNEGAQ